MFKLFQRRLRTSLNCPQPHGVGTMGKTARDFVDFSGGGAPDLLASASAWSYRLRDSPYQCWQRQAIRI